MRETVIWIIFILALMLSSFEFGYILRGWQHGDDLRKITYQNEKDIGTLTGRVTGLETTLKIKK